MKLKICVANKTVTHSLCPLLSPLPVMCSGSALHKLIHVIDIGKLCCGSMDQRYLDLWYQRSLTLHGSSGKTQRNISSLLTHLTPLPHLAHQHQEASLCRGGKDESQHSWLWWCTQGIAELTNTLNLLLCLQTSICSIHTLSPWCTFLYIVTITHLAPHMYLCLCIWGHVLCGALMWSSQWTLRCWALSAAVYCTKEIFLDEKGIFSKS